MAVAETHWKGGIILQALPAEGACMTLDQLAARTGLARDRVTRLVTPLNKNGLVSMVRLGCYRRTPAGDSALAAGKFKSGPKGPKRVPSKKSGLKDKLWSALRMLRKATVPELLELVDTTGLKDPDGLTTRYLLHLRKAGVTGLARKRVAGTAPTSNGYSQHILLRDLGPKAPVWKATAKQLLDPNKGGQPILPTAEVEHD